MTSDRPCTACARRNTAEARYCRHCGAALGAFEPPAEGETKTSLEGISPRQVDAAPPSAPPDQQGVFRQLCWLNGLPIAVSIALYIQVAVSGISALGQVLATAAMLLIALIAALLNTKLVGSALRLPTGRDALATLGLAAVMGPALTLAFWVLRRLTLAIQIDYLTPFIDDGWPSWVGYADVALVTPVAEELLFRGVIQPKLGQILTSNEALIVQAALFSAIHLSPVILVTHFAMGLGFGWIRRRSGSLFPGIALHGAWNAWVIWSMV